MQFRPFLVVTNIYTGDSAYFFFSLFLELLQINEKIDKVGIEITRFVFIVAVEVRFNHKDTAVVMTVRIVEIFLGVR